MKIASEISKVAPERTKVAFGSTSRSSSATELPSPPLPSHGNHIAELPGYGNMGDRGTGVTYTLITVVPDEVSSFDKDGGQDVSVSSSSGTAPDQIPAAVVVALPDPVAPVVAPSAAPVLVPLAPPAGPAVVLEAVRDCCEFILGTLFYGPRIPQGDGWRRVSGVGRRQWCRGVRMEHLRFGRFRCRDRGPWRHIAGIAICPPALVA